MSLVIPLVAGLAICGSFFNENTRSQVGPRPSLPPALRKLGNLVAPKPLTDRERLAELMKKSKKTFDIFVAPVTPPEVTSLSPRSPYAPSSWIDMCGFDWVDGYQNCAVGWRTNAASSSSDPSSSEMDKGPFVANYLTLGAPSATPLLVTFYLSAIPGTRFKIYGVPGPGTAEFEEGEGLTVTGSSLSCRLWPKAPGIYVVVLQAESAPFTYFRTEITRYR